MVNSVSEFAVEEPNLWRFYSPVLSDSKSPTFLPHQMFHYDFFEIVVKYI